MDKRFRYLAILLLSFLCFAALFRAPASAQVMSKGDKLYRAWLADKPYISEINIEGNNFFSDSKIKSRLFSRKNSFFQMLKSGSRNRVLRYTINRDTLEVKYMYYREGFLNISVNESIQINAEDSSAIIDIKINEGKQLLIGEVKFVTNHEISFYVDLHRVAYRLKTGNPVDPIGLNAIVFDLKTIFSNNGYPYATVKTDVDTTRGAQNTNITITADEGSLVHFGDLLIDNLRYYSPELARREIVLGKGNIYSRQKILESQKRLYSTGIFNSASLEFVKQPDFTNGNDSFDLNPDFRFLAVERKPHYITVQTGASQDSLQDLSWDFSAAWGKRNFWTSRRLEFSIKTRFLVSADPRITLHRYQARLTDPWFAGIRLPLTLTARFEPGVRSQVQSYRVQTWLLALSTRKEWSEKLYAIISGEYESVNIYGVAEDEKEAIRREENISARPKLTFVLVRDSRRDKFVPQSGSYTTYYAQYVGGIFGGDDSFYKLEFSWARYQKVLGSPIYAYRIKAGYVKEMWPAQEVPINDRFYLGGANSIRGFRENIIGPRTDDHQTEDSATVGANAYVIINNELRFPIYKKLWGSLFSDIGNGFESIRDINPEDFLFAYGVGLQFISPAGPLRLDYARRLENGIYREDDRWHITILYAF